MPDRVPSFARFAARTLLVLLAVMATLSADQAERLGINALRMPAFTLVTLGLVALGLAVQPWVDLQEAKAPVLLFLLIAAIALLDLQGPVDPIDYKLLLPVLVMFSAGSIATALGPIDLPRVLWRIL